MSREDPKTHESKSRARTVEMMAEADSEAHGHWHQMGIHWALGEWRRACGCCDALPHSLSAGVLAVGNTTRWLPNLKDKGMPRGSQKRIQSKFSSQKAPLMGLCSTLGCQVTCLGGPGPGPETLLPPSTLLGESQW